MKKRMRMLASLALAGAMVLSMTACSGSSKSQDANATDSGTKKEDVKEGKVLNIWCWNDEFQSRFNDYYPEVKEVAEDKSTTTLNDGTTVKWTINPNENNNYQDKLDTALQAQATASDDEKIDIFLIEADYALKYVDANANVAEPLSDLGITDDDLADQYQYTKDIVTDANGAQRGTSWQATPGLFAYRRSIAKDVLGTDDPEKVQEKLKDWDSFNKVAAEA
ncbi:MAG: carbohydrate ABC transporter substrate-binding protein, partial [Lachnospiraceae bacterium]|nr:carbohydrate ABC transporter substrate-binding protein [Lachnospiraceae bacterium]